MNRNAENDASNSRIGCIKLRANRTNRSKSGVYGCKLACCTAQRGHGAVNPVLTTARKDACFTARSEPAGAIFRGEGCMALKVELKPHERIIIGACVITNTDQR